jgi:hypothetical protein
MATINKIINEMAKVAVSHPELESFGWGDLSEVNNFPDEMIKFTQLWVEPVGTQLIMNKNNSFIERRFILYCWDLIRSDDKNSLSNLNAMEGILIDYIKLINEVSGWRVMNQPILTPTYDRFFDRMYGWFAEVTIEVPETVGTCDILTETYNISKPPLNRGHFWINLDEIRNG